jgi:hypothetical protein
MFYLLKMIVNTGLLGSVGKDAVFDEHGTTSFTHYLETVLLLWLCQAFFVKDLACKDW